MKTAQSQGSIDGWPLRALLLLLLVFCSSGATCSRGFRNPFAQLGPPAPDVLVVGSSLDQVVGAVNQNASRIVSYQTNDARITVPGMPGIPLLRGNIAAMQPGKVRLRASTPLTGDEVDLGSNDELFWFWVKRNQPPALYFSRHDQFAGSAAQQFMPIEPGWLLDALGMMQFSPNDRHEGPFPQGDGAVEIRSILQTRGGQMSKSTIVDARRAWVLAQHIYDANGTLVATTTAKDHRYYPEVGVSLPQEIELRVPAAELSLSIDVGTVQLNGLIDNPALWTLPTIAPQIDLGTAAPGTIGPIRAAGSNDLSTLASPTALGIVPQQPISAAIAAPFPTAPASVLSQSTPTSIALAPVNSRQQVDPQPAPQVLRPGGVAIPVGVR
ncbi:MAG: hypothetical protein AAGD11_20105 [Planctomycetota bacterium]